MTLFKGNTVVGLGDSLTAGNDDSTNEKHGDESWFSQAIIRSKGKLVRLYNAGIPGHNTTQMVERLERDVLSKKPKVCTVGGGTNDLFQEFEFTVTKRNLEYIYNRLINEGITPILVTLPPINDEKYHARITETNIFIKKCAAKYGLAVIDLNKVLTDPETGFYKTGYNKDGTHMNDYGAKIASEEAVRVTNDQLNGYEVFLPTSNIDPKNLLKNGLFLHETNGLASNWWTNLSAEQVSLSIDAEDTGQIIKKLDTYRECEYSQTILEGFSTGDKLAFSGRIITDKDVEESGMKYSVELSFNGTNYSPSPVYKWSKELDGVFYIEAVVPEGTIHITPKILLELGTGTLKIAQWGVYNLTQMNI